MARVTAGFRYAQAAQAGLGAAPVDVRSALILHAWRVFLNQVLVCEASAATWGSVAQRWRAVWYIPALVHKSP